MKWQRHAMLASMVLFLVASVHQHVCLCLSDSAQTEKTTDQKLM